ncbi:hypothetical protein AAMO2058_001218100 [Amorphochlora amoebiformis]
MATFVMVRLAVLREGSETPDSLSKKSRKVRSTSYRKGYMPEAPANVRAQDADSDWGKIRAKRGEFVHSCHAGRYLERQMYCDQVRGKEQIKWTIIFMINLEDIDITSVRLSSCFIANQLFSFNFTS